MVGEGERERKGMKKKRESMRREGEKEEVQPVIKSWMAAISGSPFLGVTRFDFVCNITYNTRQHQQLHNSNSGSK